MRNWSVSIRTSSDTNRFFVRYIHDSWNTITPTSLWSGDSFPTVGTGFVGPGMSLVAHLATNVSPTLLNEFTFSYTTDHIFLTPSGTWQRPSGMTMTGLFDNGFGGKLPGMSINNGDAVRWRLYGGRSGLALEQRQPHLHLPRSDREDLGIAQHLRRFLSGGRAEKRKQRRGDSGFPEFQQLVADQHRATLGRISWRAASLTSTRPTHRPSITTATKCSSRTSRTIGTCRRN